MGGDEGSGGAGVRRYLAMPDCGDTITGSALAFEKGASGGAVDAANEFGDDGFAGRSWNSRAAPEAFRRSANRYSLHCFLVLASLARRATTSLKLKGAVDASWVDGLTCVEAVIWVLWTASL